MKKINCITAKLFFAFLCITVVGCSTLNSPRGPVSIFHNTENIQGVEKVENNLFLSNLRLSPWLGKTPKCNHCEVLVAQIDRPSGPSRVISIEEKGKVQWLFLDSRIRNISSSIGKFSFDQSQQLIFSTTEQEVTIALNDTVKINDCQITFDWYNSQFKTVEGISNEQPDVHFQVLYSCA
ncbi:hypothetical protein [Reinekea sp.]|jgi:hypothetical protein|uniref:hypothetical protein n=1 Tax=Reinekea sp. TaxID=1970455 RepID=UPI0039892B77